ncbi:MAG: hypothetical protein JXR84_22420 [Anaerolineae bacterium]|nr:hypothetical protein [Anaerolineae bacterium]
MSHKMICNMLFLALMTTLLIACGEQAGNTPLSSPTARASLSAVSTAGTPEYGCTVDEDCAFAVRLDRCCDCGAIYSKQYVDAEPYLLLYRERWDYAYPVPRISPAICWHIYCAECQSVPLGPICIDGMCRAAEKWNDIVRLCEKATDSQMMNNCYSQAAQHAYFQVGVEKALELCSRIQGEVAAGEPGDDKDTCFHNIAVQVGKTDVAQAREICERMTERVDDYIKSIGKTED